MMYHALIVCSSHEVLTLKIHNKDIFICFIIIDEVKSSQDARTTNTRLDCDIGTLNVVVLGEH